MTALKSLGIILPSVMLGIGIGWFSRGEKTALATHPVPQPSRRAQAISPAAALSAKSTEAKLDQNLAALDRIRALAESGKPNEALISHLRGVLSNSWEGDRQRDWALFMGAMRPEDAEGVRLLFRECDKQGRWYETEFRQFWTMWGELDGQGAIDYALKNEENPHPVVIKSLKGWATKDADAALAWADANGGTEEKLNVYDGMGDVSVEKLLRYLERRPYDPSHDQALGYVPGRIAYQQGMAATKEWAAQFVQRADVAQPVKNEVMQNTLELAGRTGPEGFIQYAETLADKISTYRVGEMIGGWLRDAPQRGMSLLEKFPEGSEARVVGSQRLLDAWVEKDVTATSVWLTEHPKDAAYQHGARRLANALESSDPEAAAAWRKAAEQSARER